MNGVRCCCFFIVVVVVASMLAIASAAPAAERLLLTVNGAPVTGGGDSVRLQCPTASASNSTTSSTRKLIVQWFKETTKLNKFKHAGKYELADVFLTIRRLHANDSGHYRCRVANGFGAEPLATAHIRLVVVSGGRVESTTTSNSTQTTTTLLLTSSAPTANNNSNSNNNNSASKSPATRQQRAHNYHKYTRALGTRVQFRCNATTTTTATIGAKQQQAPTPDVIWYKNGVVLAEEDYGVTRGRWRIELNELRSSDAGNYSCRAFTRSSPPLLVRFELRVVVVEDADVEDSVEGEQQEEEEDGEEKEEEEGEDKNRSSNVTIKAGGDVVLTCRHSFSSAPAAQSLKWMKQISRAEYKNYVSQNSAASSSSSSTSLLQQQQHQQQQRVPEQLSLQDFNAEIQSLYTMSTPASSPALLSASNNANAVDDVNTDDDDDDDGGKLIPDMFSVDDNDNDESDDLLLNGRFRFEQASDNVDGKQKRSATETRRRRRRHATREQFETLQGEARDVKEEEEQQQQEQQENDTDDEDAGEEESVHYITLHSSPLIVQTTTNSGGVHTNRLLIRQADVKDAGIYVCLADQATKIVRKAYVRVLPSPTVTHTSPINPTINQQVSIDDSQPKWHKEVSSSNSNANGGSMQIIGVVLILVPVVLTCVLALGAICFLRHLVEQRAALLIKSQQLKHHQRHDDLERQVGDDNDDDDDGEDTNSQKQATTTTTTTMTTTTRKASRSLGTTSSSSSSDTSSTTATTLAFHYANAATAAAAAGAAVKGSPAPPLPNSQPPTFKSLQVNSSSSSSSNNGNDATASLYMNGTTNASSVYGCERRLSRAESTPSMAYYKIVDCDLIDWHSIDKSVQSASHLKHQQCYQQQQQQQQQQHHCSDSLSDLDEPIDLLSQSTSTRLYYQLTP